MYNIVFYNKYQKTEYNEMFENVSNCTLVRKICIYHMLSIDPKQALFFLPIFATYFSYLRNKMPI